MEETIDDIVENVGTPPPALIGKYFLYHLNQKLMYLPIPDVNIVLSRMDCLEGKMDAINETLKLILGQQRIFAETSGKVIAEQLLVAKSIKTIDERFHFLVQGVEMNQMDIGNYFPVKKMETLEELRVKSEEDINFKFALVRCSSKIFIYCYFYRKIFRF